MQRTEKATLPEILSPSGHPLAFPRPRPSVKLVPRGDVVSETAGALPANEASDAEGTAPGWAVRAFSLAALAATVAAAFFLVRGGYYAAVDSWVVPATLTPESDAIVQLNVQLNEQLVDRTRLRAESERNDADLASIGGAIGRLEALRTNGDAALGWSAREAKERATSMTESVASLKVQRKLLRDVLARGESFAKAAAKNVSEGLAPALDRERELQAVAQTRLALAETERQVQTSRQERDALLRMSDALRTRPTDAGPRLPEIVDRQERDVRVALDVERLEAEGRALVTTREANRDALAKREDSIAQLRRRPIFRALEASADIAFVPYSQIGGVEAGADLVTCRAVLFGCRIVGRVAEVLPGEVTSPDPWTEMSRGQYVLLALTDRQAAQQRTLRVRRHAPAR